MRELINLERKNNIENESKRLKELQITNKKEVNDLLKFK